MNTGQEHSILLPDELRTWAERNAPALSRLRSHLSKKTGMVSETDMWEMVAETCSPEWIDARFTLRAAEAQLQELARPENVPLGAIGRALASDDINAAGTRHALALAGFTIVDEGLRDRGDLRLLLETLMQHQRMIHKSLETTLVVRNVTADFAIIAAPNQRQQKKTQSLLAKAFSRGKDKIRKRSVAPKPVRPEV